MAVKIRQGLLPVGGRTFVRLESIAIIMPYQEDMEYDYEIHKHGQLRSTLVLHTGLKIASYMRPEALADRYARALGEQGQKK